MILNRQRRVRVKLRALDEFFRRAAALLNIPHDATAICLVTEAKITKWNGAYRGKDRSTDVLSFPAAIRTQNGNGKKSRISKAILAETIYLGDIAIAPAVAQRNARLAGHSFDQEIQILTLHGLLHLMGHDHETDNGEMDRLEARLRRKLGLA